MSEFHLYLLELQLVLTIRCGLTVSSVLLNVTCLIFKIILIIASAEPLLAIIERSTTQASLH